MKAIKNFNPIFGILFLLTLILSALQVLFPSPAMACFAGTVAPTPPPPKANAAPSASKLRVSAANSKAIGKIDNKIESTKSKVSDYKKFRTKSLHIAVINEVAHHDSRGWVKLDGKPTYDLNLARVGGFHMQGT